MRPGRRGDVGAAGALKDARFHGGYLDAFHHRFAHDRGAGQSAARPRPRAGCKPISHRPPGRPEGLGAQTELSPGTRTRPRSGSPCAAVMGEAVVESDQELL